MELDARGLGLLALALVALIQTARLAWRRHARRWTLARRTSRARRGERDAEGLLEGAGYRVIGRQVRGSVIYVIDGSPREAEVVIDLLVERAGERFVAEVKTGERAPDPLARATRRQLLEYAHAFEGAGVVLVDPEAGVIHAVRVPERAARRAWPWAWLAAGALVGWALSVLGGEP